MMLQANKHVICTKSSSRGWLPKGLSEIEEMEREETSAKVVQGLERFMRKHPDVWKQDAVQRLLGVIGNTQHTRFVNNGTAQERLDAVITGIVAPMTEILEAEQESLRAEKQKMLEATLALQRVREECQCTMADWTTGHTRAARGLEVLAMAQEDNRVAAEEAARKLTEKEAQIQFLLQQHQALVIRLTRGGPAEFLKWAEQEIQSLAIGNLKNELEQAWCSNTDSKELHHYRDHQAFHPEAPRISIPSNTSDSFVETACVKTLFVHPDPLSSLISGGKEQERDTGVRCCYQSVSKQDEEKPALTKMVMSLLGVAVSETVEQMVESYGRVKGPWSLPFAVAGFWMGLACRITCLAIVTIIPTADAQVEEKGCEGLSQNFK